MLKRSIVLASCFLISCGGQVTSSESSSSPAPSSTSSGSPGNPGGSSTPSAPAPIVDATAPQGTYASIAVWKADVGAVYAINTVASGSGDSDAPNLARIESGASTPIFSGAIGHEIGQGLSLVVTGAAGEAKYWWQSDGMISSPDDSSGVMDIPGASGASLMFIVDDGGQTVYYASQLHGDSPISLASYFLSPPNAGQSVSPTTTTIFPIFAPTGLRLSNGTLYAIQNGYEVDVDLATMNQTPFAQKDLPAFTDITARTADGSVFLASNDGVWVEKNGGYSSFLKTTHGAVTQVEVAGTSLVVLEVDPNSGAATLAEISITNATGENVIATDVTSQARFAFDATNVYFISADQTRVQHVAL
jgi:hypothetical protein